MAQSLRILGPNLPAHIVEKHGETFHVHAEYCADVNRYGRDERPRPWIAAPGSFAELARDIYDDQIEEGSMTLQDAMDDIWLAPCVKEI